MQDELDRWYFLVVKDVFEQVLLPCCKMSAQYSSDRFGKYHT